MAITLSEGEIRQLDVQLRPIPLEPARLHGYVTDFDTGAAIAGAHVELDGPYYYSALTNADGYYDIAGIAPGTYNGLVSADGYESYAF